MVRPDGTFRSFSFSARKYADGTVDGELQLNSRGFDVFVHIKIDCLRVVGNDAFMSGTITNSNNPLFEGRSVIFNVEDNGEGANSLPDRISLVGIAPAGVQINCNSNIVLQTVPIEEGNIQVKP